MGTIRWYCGTNLGLRASFVAQILSFSLPFGHKKCRWSQMLCIHKISKFNSKNLDGSVARMKIFAYIFLSQLLFLLHFIQKLICGTERYCLVKMLIFLK